MKFFFLSIALIIGIASNAQFTQQWLTTYNGDGDYSDHFTCVIEGEGGNIYAAGYTQKTDENADFLVCKFNSSGQLVWTRSWHGSGQGPDIAYAVAFGNNTLYAAGEVSNSGLGFDFFTIAISTAGDSIWGAHYNDPTFNQYDQANAICIDNLGNVIVAGESDRDPSSIINDDFLTIKYTADGTLLWAKRYNHTGNATDRAVAVAADSQGNINVAGRVNNGGDDDYALLQYNASGALNWSQFFDNGDIDRAADMGMDANGNIYVTGRSNNGNDDDFRTLKYNSSGVLQFNVAFDFVEDDRADFIDVASNGTFAIAGRSDGTSAPIVNYNYRVLKYSADGAQIWSNTYDGAGGNDDIVQDIDINEAGEVLVTGYSDANATAVIQNNMVSIKYTSAGTAAWTNSFNGPSSFDDEPGACLIDSQGNARIAGHSENQTAQRDAILLTYNSSGSTIGNTSWNGSGDNSDNVREMVKDNSGNIYVAGYSVGKDTDRDMFLMKINTAGDTVWTRSTSGTLFGSDEEANSIALDNSGNIIIGGYTKNSGTGSDITIQKFNGNGTLLWTAQYNSPANESDRGYDIATDATGNIYITGKTDIDASPIITNDEIFTAKYSSSGMLMWSAVHNGGSGYQRGRAISVSSTGSVYVCGQSFNGTDEDIIAIKYSASGAQTWQYIFNSGQSDIFRQCVFNADESITIAGIQANSTLVPAESQLLILRVNNNGQEAWHNTYNSTAGLSSIGEAIKTAPNGNFVVCGSVFNPAQPDNSYGCLIVCYSADGQLTWEQTYQSTLDQNDIGDALSIDANSNVVAAYHSNIGSVNEFHYVIGLIAYDSGGNFLATTTIDESDSLNVCNELLLANGMLYLAGSRWSQNGQRDIMIAQYGAVLTTENYAFEPAVIYPNPVNDNIHLTLGQQQVGKSYSIYDSFGKKIQEGKLTPEVQTIHCTSLAPGMYTILISSDKANFSTTFIKQ